MISIAAILIVTALFALGVLSGLIEESRSLASAWGLAAAATAVSILPLPLAALPSGRVATLSIGEQLTAGRPGWWSILPRAVRGGVVQLTGYAGDVLDIPQDDVVLWLNIQTIHGQTARYPIRAGREIFEYSIERPDVAAAVRHRRANIERTFTGHWRGCADFTACIFRSWIPVDGSQPIRAVSVRLDADIAKRYAPSVVLEGLEILESAPLPGPSSIATLISGTAPWTLDDSSPVLALSVDSDEPVGRIRMLSRLSNSVQTPQGARIGEVIVDGGGEQQVLPVWAGVDVSEWAFLRQDLAGSIAHCWAPGHWCRDEDVDRGCAYYSIRRLPHPMNVERVTLRIAERWSRLGLRWTIDRLDLCAAGE